MAQAFIDQKIRAQVDNSDETVGKKIRAASQEKVNYILVIGDKEVESSNLNVRDRGQETTREIAKAEFISEILEKIKTRSN